MFLLLPPPCATMSFCSSRLSPLSGPCTYFLRVQSGASLAPVPLPLYLLVRVSTGYPLLFPPCRLSVPDTRIAFRRSAERAAWCTRVLGSTCWTETPALTPGMLTVPVREPSQVGFDHRVQRRRRLSTGNWKPFSRRRARRYGGGRTNTI